MFVLATWIGYEPGNNPYSHGQQHANPFERKPLSPPRLREQGYSSAKTSPQRYRTYTVM